MNARPKGGHASLCRHLRRGAREVLRLLHAAHREGRQDHRDARRQRLHGPRLVPRLARAFHSHEELRGAAPAAGWRM